MSDLTVELTAPNGRKYVQPTGLFINNEWVKGSAGEMITSINPSFVCLSILLVPILDLLTVQYRDESEITKVHAASADDVDKAVAAARKAFKDPSWRDMAPSDRGELMFKLSALIEKNKETLATIETWDNGTPPFWIHVRMGCANHVM